MHRLYHPLRESTNYPHWDEDVCICESTLVRLHVCVRASTHVFADFD